MLGQKRKAVTKLMLPNKGIRQFFEKRAASYDSQTNRYITERRATFVRRFLKGRVLDVGLGSGQLAALYGKPPLVGTDVALNMLRLANIRLPGIMLVVSDAEYMAFQSGSFDTIVCSELIYYLDSPLTFLRDVARVLRPNGRLVILWGNSKLTSFFRLATFLGLRPDDPHSLRTPSKKDIRCWLDDAFPNSKRKFSGLGWSRRLDHILEAVHLNLHPVNAVVIDKG